ncbi:putative O-methyltransferase [Frankia casuarinae]|jgi:caffeoyl-CoA O-methyltransferase|uniref:O-methyltransferase, family 3 n=1 Tax=Frankia casuarinae (strain DSM 45818 / CECT 9043 / HFP020203 / CcI3) TaxID=106370 RepID=Q2J8K4_FRACC|nr:MULTISPECIES: class I SAM-dependent methyltransferase [Frankia]ABD12388.1 O-methyltransferase, family 3 [Frankia casuarinae]ETA02345.1 putative O-methyltransferase [Frankia sp. CcI6]EYT91290.1 putative O-methyltransferase [Frankia casuarinae]KDA44790.1 putative O-methyltransferase [Frankia sp. BMG5.23]KEZ36639.1 putative O-methyltransferase [Frankia sp. CeD]
MAKSPAQKIREVATTGVGTLRREGAKNGKGLKSAYLADPIHSYLTEHSSPPDPILDALSAVTATLPEAEMQVPAEQGTFLTILTASIAPRRAVEIGTFTGYSALCIARGLPPGGRLLCLDISAEWTSIARQYWARAGVSDHIDLALGPAADSLGMLPEEPTFDLAFIDADKTSYRRYYELLFPRMNPNGVIIVDNVLQYGHVVRSHSDNPAVVAVKQFNELLAGDSRVQVVMLPIADGLTIVRKLPSPRTPV